MRSKKMVEGNGCGVGVGVGVVHLMMLPCVTCEAVVL